jgi:hypothetical protein
MVRVAPRFACLLTASVGGAKVRWRVSALCDGGSLIGSKDVAHRLNRFPNNPQYAPLLHDASGLSTSVAKQGFSNLNHVWTVASHIVRPATFRVASISALTGAEGSPKVT